MSAGLKESIAARIVGAILPVAIVSIIASTAGVLLLSPQQWTRVVPGALTFLLMLPAALCFWRKKYVASGNFLVVGLVGAIVLGMLKHGGALAPVYILILPLTAIVIWLHGTQAGIVTACCCYVAGLLSVVALSFGLLSPPPPVAPWLYMVLMGVYLLAILATTLIPSRMLRHALQQSQANEREALALASVVEQAAEGIAIADLSGVLRYANTAWLEMHGYKSIREVVGRNLSVFHTEEQVLQDVAPFNELVIKNGTHYGEVGHMRIDGATFPTHMTVTLMRDAEGQPTEFVAFAQDISELKRLGEKARASERLQSLGQLAGGIAHDFNNMVAGILGAAEVLERRLPSDDQKLQHWVELIKSTADRAGQLTAKLLAFARKGKGVEVQADVHDLIRDTLSLLERSIDKRITICADLSARQSLVCGDPAQIQSAILNVGINARDAMPEGGKLSIATRNVQYDESYCRGSSFELSPGDYVEIEIRDTGAGMEKETLSHIFEPFFTTKEVGKGTGLGLAAVYGTVCMHRGRISVWSEPGDGSTFVLGLPVEAVKAERPETGEAGTTGSACILVVDDEEVIRESCLELLQDLGHDVLVAADGETGVEVFSRNADRIDLVILDMTMPKMNGVECFRAIRHMREDARIIIASGFAHNEMVQSLESEGATAFLKKPYRVDELSKAVALALQE